MVAQTHVNGTNTIELQQGFTERINIRRVIPCKELFQTHLLAGGCQKGFFRALLSPNQMED